MMKNSGLRFIIGILIILCIFELLLLSRYKSKINSFTMVNPRKIEMFYLPFGVTVLNNFFFSSRNTLTSSSLKNVYKGTIADLYSNMQTKSLKIIMESNNHKKQFLLSGLEVQKLTTLNNFGETIPLSSLSIGDSVEITETVILNTKIRSIKYTITKFE